MNVLGMKHSMVRITYSVNKQNGFTAYDELILPMKNTKSAS